MLRTLLEGFQVSYILVRIEGRSVVRNDYVRYSMDREDLIKLWDSC